jgi:hypothetical protein
MDTVSKVVDYFLQDPLRVLALIGGSGGVAYWVALYRGRSRIAIRDFRELTARSATDPRPCIQFEAESLGKDPVSLAREIQMTGYTPRRERREYTFRIEGADRGLSPYDPKRFEAITGQDPVIPHLWFKTYVVTPTRGRRRKLRIQSGHGNALSWVWHALGLIGFKMGRVPSGRTA